MVRRPPCRAARVDRAEHNHDGNTGYIASRSQHSAGEDMADIGRVRMRLPASIKPGEVVKVRVLVTHPMEIVQRKDGKPVDKNYHFIHKVVVTYLGREVAEFETTQSISENPFFSFSF